jgi:hypothetical protein
MIEFRFLQENNDKLRISYERIVETVNFNMNVLYDGNATQQQIDDMILEVCRQLDVNPNT